MKITSGKMRVLRIPFKGEFAHHLKTRHHSESIILEVIDDSGNAGYGEGAPRPYVTGESVESSLGYIHHTLIPAVKRLDLDELDWRRSPFEALSILNSYLPEFEKDNDITFNASKAALETALLDLCLKRYGKSLATVIGPKTKSVRYSAVIPALSTTDTGKLLEKCRQFELKQVKLKVGLSNDLERIETARRILGEDASIRIDANGAFDLERALCLIRSIKQFNIASFEQPMPPGEISDLARLKMTCSIPIMVDESLITEEDARALIINDACDIFNLRVSKNGGILNTLRLAELARRNRITFQIGCQVGETAILSAAGRHLAAHLSDAIFVEGSYGTWLLEEDIGAESVQFAYGGEAPLLNAPGLGVDVHRAILDKHSIKTREVFLQ